MSELKPCPFCGNEPVVEGNLVACNNLNCPTHDNYWTDPMIFTCDQWNTRPIEDALNARLAELEKDNDEFRQLIHDWIIILTPDDGYVPDSECNDVATPIDVALRKRIAGLEAENNELKERVAMLDVNAVYKSLGEMGYIEQVDKLNARIAELEAENDRLQSGWFRDETICPDGSLRPTVSQLLSRIAELEALVEGHDPFEDFPPKERGFDCSVLVLGKFEYEEEFTSFTNWDLCVYWFDEERWHPLNGYVKGDDIVRWYALPYKEREK